MKNIIKFETKQSCLSCNKYGFFTQNVYNKDYSCPLCGQDSITFNKLFKAFAGNDSDQFDDYDDSPDENLPISTWSLNWSEDNLFWYYCPWCFIVFQLGCTHMDKSRPLLNTHFISKYIYQNQTYNGMPQFESQYDAQNKLSDIKVIQTICPNRNWICINYNSSNEREPCDQSP